MPELVKHKFPWIPETKKQKGIWYDDPRYHTHRWRKYRISFFKRSENKLCVRCKEAGKVVKATHIGHIIPVSQDLSDDNFWNSNNHKPLCKSCNARETHLKQ